MERFLFPFKFTRTVVTIYRLHNGQNQFSYHFHVVARSVAPSDSVAVTCDLN